MRRLTFKQLRIFEAVATEHGYTRAAKALHLTQPAVSIQIKQMEEWIGLPLFEKTGKHFRLTEAGRELWRYTQEIHHKLEEAALAIGEMKGLKRGHLHLTMASTANYFAPQLLATFCARHPDVQITLDVVNRAGLLRALEENTTDIVIMGKPPAAMPVHSEIFMENPLVVIAPPDHPWRDRAGIPLSEIATEPFIVREHGSGTRAAVERFLARHDLERPSGMEMNSSEAIKQAVRAGLGLGVVSLYTLEMELELKRLCILDVEDFPIMRHWRIVYRKDKRFSAVAQAFRDFIVEEAAATLKTPEEHPIPSR